MTIMYHLHANIIIPRHRSLLVLYLRIANENQVWDKKLGLAGIWGPLVKEWLEEVLPHDIDRDTLDKIHVRITPLLVFKGTKLVSNFSCRSDLIGIDPYPYLHGRTCVLLLRRSQIHRWIFCVFYDETPNNVAEVV